MAATLKDAAAASAADAELDALANIPHPYREVQRHVTVRCAQMGAVFGVVIGGTLGALAAARGRTTWAAVGERVGRAAVIGAVWDPPMNGLVRMYWLTACLTAAGIRVLTPQGVGSVISFPMTYGRLRNEPQEAIYDRAYRLRCNEGQNRFDRTSVYAASTAPRRHDY